MDKGKDPEMENTNQEQLAKMVDIAERKVQEAQEKMARTTGEMVKSYRPSYYVEELMMAEAALSVWQQVSKYARAAQEDGRVYDTLQGMVLARVAGDRVNGSSSRIVKVMEDMEQHQWVQVMRVIYGI